MNYEPSWECLKFYENFVTKWMKSDPESTDCDGRTQLPVQQKVHRAV